MKITICGSVAFFQEMLDAQKQLQDLGHEVKIIETQIPDEQGNMIPVTEYYKIRKSGQDKDWIWDRKKKGMMWHFEKIAWGDAILVLNYDKNDIENYVGPNTLIEMGLALYLDKKVYLLNPVPEMKCKEEILGTRPVILNSDLSVI